MSSIPFCTPWLNDARTSPGVISHCFAHPTQAFALRVSILSPQIIRLEYSPTGRFDDAPSYGVSPKFSPAAGEVTVHETTDSYIVQTQSLHLHINKEALSTDLFTAQGDAICQDATPPTFSAVDWVGDYSVQFSKSIRSSDYFFGLGDKPCSLNLKGKQFEMWGADHYDFHEHSDPLYKNIPFFLAVSDTQHFGLFFDNTCRSRFDFGFTDPHKLIISSHGEPLDYYLIHAPTPLDTIALYTRLTGLPTMPPRWTLGYHQSKWSYYPDTVVKNLAQALRSKQFPCDAIHLDIHHLQGKEAFFWCKSSFPNPAQLHQDLAQQGFKTVAISNPGVKISTQSSIWQEGMQGNHFCRRANGALLEGDVWPGRCMFPDFTRQATRDWWSHLLRSHILSQGVRGLWNDMNEPAISSDRTFPDDTRHNYDGRPATHLKAHNIYGHCMIHAAHQAMLDHTPEHRPFLLTRSAYAGMQRVSATWTGDNNATWEHLRIANMQCQRLAASGISFAGSDVGGFLGLPTQQLFCRWMQLAAFHVFFRNHNSGEVSAQEPWCFGEEVSQHVRHAINTRYRLLPYFYTEFYRYATLGTPMIRSLALQCPHIRDTHWRAAEFFLGDHLYIIPISNPDESGAFLYLPPGTWYDYHSGALMPQAEEDIWVDCDLSHIPVYVHGGAIIPHWPLQQFVGELLTPPVTLVTYWASFTTRTSYLYEDAGDGDGYSRGDFLYHTLTYASTNNSLSILSSRQGQGNPTDFSNQHILTLHALPITEQQATQTLIIRIDGTPVDASLVTLMESPTASTTLTLPLPTNFSLIEINW